MKRQEAQDTGRPLSREVRAIKSIEPNGEEPPRRSNRLKPTLTKVASNVSSDIRRT